MREDLLPCYAQTFDERALKDSGNMMLIRQ